MFRGTAVGFRSQAGSERTVLSIILGQYQSKFHYNHTMTDMSYGKSGKEGQEQTF